MKTFKIYWTIINQPVLKEKMRSLYGQDTVPVLKEMMKPMYGQDTVPVLTPCLTQRKLKIMKILSKMKEIKKGQARCPVRTGLKEKLKRTGTVSCPYEIKIEVSGDRRNG